MTGVPELWDVNWQPYLEARKAGFDELFANPADTQEQIRLLARPRA